MYSYVYQHRVRYRECDPMGVVYHSHYLDYFEVARTEALREMGLAYKRLEETGIIMPVIDLAVQYKGPAYYDDLLEIKACFGARPTMRVRVDYEVRRVGQEAVLAAGHVTLCFLDQARQRPVRAPALVKQVFERTLTEQAADAPG